MIPNITRGGNMAGLVGYLGGKGNHNEHVRARIITGSASVQLRTGYKVTSIQTPGPRREFSALLDAPHRESGRKAPIPVKDRAGNRVGTRDGHVWHCSLGLPTDEPVNDLMAAELAHRFVQQMELDRCEWAAIRHDRRYSNPHLHLVVNIVKPDGKLASTHRDYSRAQAACARITADLGLTELQGQQRHLPKAERARGIKSRPLTGRYKRLHNKIGAAASTVISVDQLPTELKARGVLWRQTEHRQGRRGISFAELDRPDVWLRGTEVGWKESHLLATIRSNAAAAPARPPLAAEYDPRPQWEKDLDLQHGAAAAEPHTASPARESGIDR